MDYTEACALVVACVKYGFLLGLQITLISISIGIIFGFFRKEF